MEQKNFQQVHSTGVKSATRPTHSECHSLACSLQRTKTQQADNFVRVMKITVIYPAKMLSKLKVSFIVDAKTSSILTS